jgi:rSAM/selenodomain-associated transferase 2
VIDSPPGRGRQMNAGAAVTTGDAVLFLHGDTTLPEGFAEHVARVLARPGVVAGAFELRIDAPHRALRLVEAAVNRRSRWFGLPYGDQAIFLPAATFRQIGGYSEAEAMEDFAIIRRLRRLGRVSIAPAHVNTSARRWLAGGIWRTTLLNQVCVAAWIAGVSGHRIARWRGTASRSGTTTPAAVPQYR